MKTLCVTYINAWRRNLITVEKNDISFYFGHIKKLTATGVSEIFVVKTR